MDFMKLAKERFSVRKFTDQPVEQEKLDVILEAGRVAPTACNKQPQKVYVLRSEEALAKINSLCKCIFGAKTVLMITCDKNLEWQNPLEAGVCAGVQDISIAATHMMLAAWEQGIGSCWVNYFAPTEIAKAFNLPDNEQLVLLMPLGYAAEGAKPAPLHEASRDIKEMVTYL